jgi:hypothetical protein
MLGGGGISIQQKMIKIGTFENKVQIWSFKTLVENAPFLPNVFNYMTFTIMFQLHFLKI